MSAKTIATKTGNGILNATSRIVVAAYDGPRKKEIAALDTTIAMLQKDRDRLVAELMDPTDV